MLIVIIGIVDFYSLSLGMIIIIMLGVILVLISSSNACLRDLLRRIKITIKIISIRIVAMVLRRQKLSLIIIQETMNKTFMKIKKKFNNQIKKIKLV